MLSALPTYLASRRYLSTAPSPHHCRAEEQAASLKALFSEHFLLHPRWETRAASALAVELLLTKVVYPHYTAPTKLAHLG